MLLIPGALSAATAGAASAQPIYAAFALVASGNLTTKRCGGYTITSGSYGGNSTSPDQRMAGRVAFAGRVAVNSTGSSGVATGHFVIRDRQRRIRMRANLRGVVTNRVVVNGIVTGTLSRPTAQLMANVTIVFDEVLRFGAVRLGLESGLNSGVAYPPVPTCK